MLVGRRFVSLSKTVGLRPESLIDPIATFSAALVLPRSGRADTGLSCVPTNPLQLLNRAPPTITVNGNNSAIIQVGDSYADPGATVTDSAGPTSAAARSVIIEPISATTSTAP